MSDNTNPSAAGGVGLVTVILALVFLFVWPGPLRYEYRIGKDIGIMRIDRLNGHVSTLFNGHYKRVTNVQQGHPW
jgi:hypothetical protein